MERPPPTKTVLLVERDEDVRAVIREVLASQGYELIATPNATEALPMLAHLDSLGLILLERQWRNDTEARFLIDMIRRPWSRTDVPIILIDPMRRDILPGTQAILRKPFTLDALLSVVETYCRKT